MYGGAQLRPFYAKVIPVIDSPSWRRPLRQRLGTQLGMAMNNSSGRRNAVLEADLEA